VSARLLKESSRRSNLLRLLGAACLLIVAFSIVVATFGVLLAPAERSYNPGWLKWLVIAGAGSVLIPVFVAPWHLSVTQTLTPTQKEEWRQVLHTGGIVAPFAYVLRGAPPLRTGCSQ
jgi:hypothetical protein